MNSFFKKFIASFLMALTCFILINNVAIKALNAGTPFYRLSAGAYANKQNADKQLSFVKSKGYSDAYISLNQSLYKVYMGSYSTRDNANTAKLTAQQKGIETSIQIVYLDTPKRENKQGLSFKLTSTSTNRKVTFNTPWVTEPKSGLQASVEGKGEFAIEEGLGKLIIKDKKGTFKVYELVGDNSKFTPKKVKWIDENSLFIIIGFPYGRVTRGGGAYILDLKTLKLGEIYFDPSIRNEVMDISFNGKDLTLKINTYIDDNMNVSKDDTWTIKDFDLNLRTKMYIKNSKGVTISTIN